MFKSILVVIVLIIVSVLGYIQSEIKKDQDAQALKCIHNQTIPVQEYGTTNIICFNKSTDKEPFDIQDPQ
jgi:hypothetical protein